MKTLANLISKNLIILPIMTLMVGCTKKQSSYSKIRQQRAATAQAQKAKDCNCNGTRNGAPADAGTPAIDGSTGGSATTAPAPAGGSSPQKSDSKATLTSGGSSQENSGSTAGNTSEVAPTVKTTGSEKKEAAAAPSETEQVEEKMKADRAKASGEKSKAATAPAKSEKKTETKPEAAIAAEGEKSDITIEFDADKKSEAVSDSSDEATAPEKAATEKEDKKEEAPMTNGTEIMKGQLTVAVDEKKVLKSTECSMQLLKSDTLVALNLLVGGLSFPIEMSGDWLGEGSEFFNVEAIKVVKQELTAVRENPLSEFKYSIRFDASSHTVQIVRRYVIVNDKSVDKAHFNEYLETHQPKMLSDSSFTGMTGIVDTLAIKLDAKGKPSGYIYDVREVVNGSAGQVAAGQKPNFKFKNHLQVKCGG